MIAHRHTVTYDTAKILFKVTGAHLIVDFGCGRGKIMGMLLKDRFSVIGFDVDIEIVEACVSRGLDVRVANITKIPLADCTVDFFIVSEVLEHLDAQEYIEATTEICRVLKSEGMVLITTPEKEKHAFHKAEHKQWISPEVLVSGFSASDFDNVYEKISYKNQGAKDQGRGTRLVVFKRKV